MVLIECIINLPYLFLTIVLKKVTESYILVINKIEFRFQRFASSAFVSFNSLVIYCSNLSGSDIF